MDLQEMDLEDVWSGSEQGLIVDSYAVPRNESSGSA
jgi:hypothetical protein